MIKFTELESNQGSIAKKYNIDEAGNVKINSAATIYDAIARPKEVAIEDVASYLDSLTRDNSKCVIPGVCGETGEEYNLVTQEKLTDGAIARTKDFFQYANGGSVSLLHLDFDGDHTNEEREQFLKELDVILADSLIGERGTDRKTICKWYRPSTSSSVSINGKVGNGLHVFIPVKKCKEDLLKLIHRFCWMHHKGYKLTAAGTILSQSLIDPSTGGPERVIYTADAEVEGPEEMWIKMDRTCRYVPGGIVDCEVASNILTEVTADFVSEWRSYKNIIQNSDEVREARRIWKENHQKKLIAKGLTPKEAKAKTKSLANLTLLSSEVLRRTDGATIKVKDILIDPDSYIGMDKFNDPIKAEEHRNVGKILGDYTSPFLHSFNHGGVKYALKWEYSDLLDWVQNCDVDELEEWYTIHILNSSISNIQEVKLHKIVGERLSVAVSSVKQDIKEARTEKENAPVERKPDETDEDISEAVYLDKTATHGDIIDDYIRRSGDCKTFGSNLYVWKGGSIWQNHSNNYIQRQLRTDYNHVGRCSKVADYKALSGAILNEETINTTTWNEAPGFPCSDGFWLVDPEERQVRKVEYTKDLLCRFKMGIKPDFDMKTPMFQKVIDNVENPILYQQLFGLAISGYLTDLQAVFCMLGAGGAGKGTTSDIMAAMLPKGRLTSVSLEQLNDERYRAVLADARVNFVSEVKAKKLDITGLKEFTGGGLITARALYNNPISFYSNCSFVVSMNRLFQLEEFGDETLRRFGYTIVKFVKRQDKQIENLSQIIIEEELPGVLAWAINGVRLFFEHGLESELSLQIYNEWTNSSDGLSNFLNDEVVFDPNAKVTTAALWERYKAYVESSNYPVEGRNDVYGKLEAHELIGPRVKTKGVWYFRGIKFNR